MADKCFEFGKEELIKAYEIGDKPVGRIYTKVYNGKKLDGITLKWTDHICLDIKSGTEIEEFKEFKITNRSTGTSDEVKLGRVNNRCYTVQEDYVIKAGEISVATDVPFDILKICLKLTQ